MLHEDCMLKFTAICSLMLMSVRSSRGHELPFQEGKIYFEAKPVDTSHFTILSSSGRKQWVLIPLIREFQIMEPAHG